MVTLQRLSREEIIVNAAHILTVEATPDTLLTLSTGDKLLVRQSCAEVVALVATYWRDIGAGPMRASVALVRRPPPEA